MVKVVASVEFFGEEFSPDCVEKETGLSLSNKKNAGDMGTSGKYKDKPLPFGSASLVTPSDIMPTERIYWLTQALSGKMDKFRECGAEDMHFMIAYFHNGYGSFELSVKEIQGISALKIPFCFSVYELEDEDSGKLV